MLLLAVDTTTTNGSLALTEADEVLCELRLARQESYSSTLVSAVEFALVSASRPASAVDLWAVAAGPGTFTGLRVGISTVQGLALATGRRCVGISALQAWAFGSAGNASAIMTLLDAMRGEAYGQLFDAQGEPLAEPARGRAEALAATAPAGTAFVGDGVAPAREAIEAACRGATFPVRESFRARAVASLARREAEAGRAQDPEALRPLYLREAALRASRPA